MRLGGRIAVGATAVGLVALGFVVVPLAAKAQQEPPPVSPEELVGSVLTAKPGAFAGSVQLDNRLGLPALPGLPQAADGTSNLRIASDGAQRGRVALPTAQGERLVVNDGSTIWFWNSADRTVTKAPASGDQRERQPVADPAEAARRMVDQVRRFSSVTVDGSSEVAGRSAYELVLTPVPTERTLLRELRVAVDVERRMPLRLSVFAQGTGEPAFQAGFTELNFAPQDDSLFTFTPPPGATVKERGAGDNARVPGGGRDAAKPTKVGDGWDTVLLARLPEQARAQAGSFLAGVGKPVSGPWGNGRLITSTVATAIVADDGRVAAGAVPEQVLTEALGR
jgi:outer membrane lipoprotein-sorting protein